MPNFTSTKDYYNRVVSRTVSNALFASNVSFLSFSSYLSTLSKTADLTSKLKRSLFYGKDCDEFKCPPNSPLSSLSDNASYIHTHSDTIHALLGLIDEAYELLENIIKPNDDNTVQNISELGDLTWFYTLLLKSMSALKPDMSLDEFLDYVRNANMTKLMVRYPDGFTSDSAINRNTTSEDQAVSSIL